MPNSTSARPVAFSKCIQRSSERSRAVLSEDAGVVPWRELTAGPQGPWVTFTDGNHAGWFAALDVHGGLRVPPRRLEGAIERPSMLVGIDESGAMRSLTVLGIRRTEVDARLVTLHYDQDARFVAPNQVRGGLAAPHL